MKSNKPDCASETKLKNWNSINWKKVKQSTRQILQKFVSMYLMTVLGLFSVEIQVINEPSNCSVRRQQEIQK